MADWFKKARGPYLLSSLATFCRDTKALPDFQHQPHQEMCDELQRVIEPDFNAVPSRMQKGIWLAPRHSYKTSILAAAMVYLVLKYPNIRIAFGRATNDDARTVLFRVKQIFQTNPIILDVWGDLSKGALIWSEEQITVGTRTLPLQEPTIDTTGIGTSKTGYHPDVVILDDLVTEKNYQSDRINEYTQLLVQSFFPILPPHGCMVLCGTRWSATDIYGWVMKEDDLLQREEDEKARKEGREARNVRQWTRYVRSVYDGPDGLFFPAVLDENYLEQQRRSLRTNMMLFSSWFYNQPYEEGTKLFPKDYIRYVGATYYRAPTPHLEMDDEHTYVPLYVSMTIDPAPTAGPKSDFTGVTVVGCDWQGKWYVLHGEAFKKLPSDGARVILDLVRVFKPHVIGIETGQADPEFVARIQSGIREMDLRVSIQSYSAVRDEVAGERGKEQRIEALEPLFRNRAIVFRRGGYYRDLLEQLDAFPAPRLKDDCVDALAMQRRFVRPCREKTKEQALDRADVASEAAEELDSWGPGGPPRKEKRVVSYVGLSSQKHT